MSDSSVATDPEVQLVEGALADLLAAHDPKAEDYVTFRGHQFDAGLAFVHFPKGHGGLNVRPEHQRIVERTLREAGAKPTNPKQFFMYLAGPTIVTHGNDEVKERFLKPMYTGEHIWCQLFSEPGAGSDFAGLGARAVRDGDEWIVNGQKVWNTLAHVADWGMLVTRSDPNTPKHKGMTYFALDMHSPGVEVRPLRQITGEAEFNEVYLTDARVPDANRVGDVGDGWRVSLTTLMNERSAIGSGAGGGAPKRGSGVIGAAVKIWQSLPADRRSPADKARLMDLWVQAEVARLTNMRASANRKAGNPGPEMSVAKLVAAELNMKITELAIDLEGPHGLIDYDYTFRRPEDSVTSSATGGVHYEFLRVRANSIEGGTSEIMRNIIGEQVLGLPGEPRVDKKVNWIDVPRN